MFRVTRNEHAGIRTIEGPLVMGGRRRVCFIRDPDDTVLEFDEILRRPQP